ncbi:MAG: potassium-transporting ATPase subunit KdpC [Pirellulales bacterium]
MLKDFGIAARMLILMTVLTGLVYPLTMTGVAQVLFPRQANGSVIADGETKVGSELLGQSFEKPENFWSRPSATSPVPYNGTAGSGSNLATTNPQLVEVVKGRIAKLKEADPDNQLAVPVDLVTSSASGLDPHISPAAAKYQVSRVAKARGMTREEVETIVKDHTEPPTLGIFGQPRVNVLKLNQALAARK